MKQHLFILTFVYALTACTQKSVTINDKQVDNVFFKNFTDTIQRNNKGQFPDDGWPEGLPKDTLLEIPLKTYSNEISEAILKSASKKADSKKLNIHLKAVYRCRAWDGEKWYTTENDYSVLVCDKNSSNNSHWIIPIEYKNGKYTAGEWVVK